MNEPLRRYAKVGLVHFMAFPDTATGDGPIAETIKKIALDDYFEVVETTWIKNSAVREQVKGIVETSHMELCYAGMPRQKLTNQNINDLDEHRRRITIENLKAGIDEAYEMNAAGFAFMSGRYSEQKKEDAYQALVKSTKELCTYAKSKGNMRMSLEIFDYDVENFSLIGPVSWSKRYAEEICTEFDNFGLMVDLSHLPQLRETPEESLIPVKNRINHAHMGNAVVRDKNNPAYGDKHPRFGFPGSENDIQQLTEYLRVLLSIGYLNKQDRPALSLEVRPVGGEDPDLVIANAKRVLNLAWDKV